MFEEKKKSLTGFKEPQAKPSAFVVAAVRRARMDGNFQLFNTGNGAVKLSTTTNDFVDQFAKATNYLKPRRYSEVNTDMTLLYSQDPVATIKLSLYLRMITRQTQLLTGERTEAIQRGQGLKHEGILRMIWLATNQPAAFFNNISLFIAAGSWKDIIEMLALDLQFNGWEKRKLNWARMGEVILSGLANEQSVNLLKKYLPSIRTKAKCNTVESQADNVIAKWICSLLYGSKPEGVADKNFYGYTYKLYRKLKASGTAHQWQQLITKKLLGALDFNTIHGRALAKLVGGKFLKNHNMEEVYLDWITKKPIAKYTGYPYELTAPVKAGYQNNVLDLYKIHTINAQFMGLVEQAKKRMTDEESAYLTVVDTSSSMTGKVDGTNVTAYSVAKTMALFFSFLLKGPFQNCYMEFADNSTLIPWKGDTPVAKLMNDSRESYGSTNFQSVGSTFVALLKDGVPESDFPKGILCVSDGCFNPANYNITSNVAALRLMLMQGGFSEEFVRNFRIVLWDIPNSHYRGRPQTAFEDFADAPNVFHMSGLDPAAVSFIVQGSSSEKKAPKDAEELFAAVMDQELLNMVVV